MRKTIFTGDQFCKVSKHWMERSATFRSEVLRYILLKFTHVIEWKGFYMKLFLSIRHLRSAFAAVCSTFGRVMVTNKQNMRNNNDRIISFSWPGDALSERALQLYKDSKPLISDI